MFNPGPGVVTERKGQRLANVEEWRQCQEHCQGNPPCTFWTWSWQFCTNCDPNACTLYIHEHVLEEPEMVEAFGHISGRVDCTDIVYNPYRVNYVQHLPPTEGLEFERGRCWPIVGAFRQFDFTEVNNAACESALECYFHILNKQEFKF